MKGFAFTFFILSPIISFSQIISTVVGTGTPGYGGDGGLSTAAQINQPIAITLDKTGNLYIADYHNSRVRKVSPSGVISTFAGNGFAGSPGDGGPATAAWFASPSGIAVDTAGNVYIADANRHNVRKVNPAGIISTVAGDSYGSFGFSGDGGPATDAKLSYPYGLACSPSGALYIADFENNVVRRVDPSGVISRFAGKYHSYGSSGDGGPATAAEINNPSDVAIDNAGNVYIAQAFVGSVRRVNSSGIISTFAGSNISGYSGDGGPATNAQLKDPICVATDIYGNVYITDRGNSRIRKVTTSGTITTIAGSGVQGYSGDNGKAIFAEIHSPQGINIDTAHNVYFADVSNSVIRKVNHICDGPNVGQIVGPSRVAPFATIALTDSSAGGTWSSSDTSIAVISSSGIVTARGFCGPSVYTTIFYTLADGCTASYSSQKVIVDFPLDLQTFVQTQNLQVMPNPAKDAVHLTIPWEFSEGNLYIFDLNGTLQKQEQIAARNFTTFLWDLPPGVYIIKVVTNTGVCQAEIIKQ